MNRLALQLSRCVNRNSLSFLNYSKTNSSSLIFNSIRNMASQPVATSNKNNNVTQSNASSSSTNELDKPQWERSDRYVNNYV
jgi:hypothetical protein